MVHYQCPSCGAMAPLAQAEGIEVPLLPESLQKHFGHSVFIAADDTLRCQTCGDAITYVMEDSEIADPDDVEDEKEAEES